MEMWIVDYKTYEALALAHCTCRFGSDGFSRIIHVHIRFRSRACDRRQTMESARLMRDERRTSIKKGKGPLMEFWCMSFAYIQRCAASNYLVMDGKQMNFNFRMRLLLFRFLASACSAGARSRTMMIANEKSEMCISLRNEKSLQVHCIVGFQLASSTSV